ncbi:hypothetical protein FB45DRAFT_102252 [Roridomyces roridus]|uniref:C3H1-type domain-containing protein n=1 Tax=Roridomyces roridus TaxID=1738132 RepID=A0AAD7FJ10_9AGAR|nr:hypothetical protein FB45DRAFT_102252 [Roridomyces roridus]
MPTTVHGVKSRPHGAKKCRPLQPNSGSLQSEMAHPGVRMWLGDPDEQAASKWGEADVPVASSSREAGQYTEPTETSWSYGTDHQNTDGQPETGWGAPEDATATEQSWNRPWPNERNREDDAVPVDDSWTRPWPETQSNARRTRKGNCLYFGQGYCPRGDACWFRHDQEAKPEPISSDEPAAPQAAPSGPVRVSEEPSFSEQLIHHCKVQFGASGVPEKVVSPFDSETLILSNYPAGISRDALLELAEPYGAVEDTTFRLTAGRC